MLTLREMNLYQASARAMELAGWVWRPAENCGQSEPPRTPAGQPRPAREVSFDDPWTAHNYPPPPLGRYVLYHRGDLSETGEPEWRPGWAWAERSEDG